MIELTQFVCTICGAAHAKSGKPFDESSLAKHMTMVHPATDTTAIVSSALVCDICGVNQSSRGKIFTLASHVWQHKKKRHPEAAEDSSPPAQLSPSVTSPQTQKTARRNRAMTPTHASHAAHVKFCPHCGFNLAIVHAAMEFVNGDLSS